jgi:hypothetical protein
MVEPFTSPLTAGAATVTVRLASAYNRYAHGAGGDAFALLPEVTLAPEGAAASVALAQAQTASVAWTTAFSAHGYGGNAVKYKAWRIVDLGVGHYALTLPHTAPGRYTVDLYIASAGCDYRGSGSAGSCARSLFRNKKLDFVVQPAGMSAAGTTGAVTCQPGPASSSSTCWLTAGLFTS